MTEGSASAHADVPDQRFQRRRSEVHAAPEAARRLHSLPR